MWFLKIVAYTHVIELLDCLQSNFLPTDLLIIFFLLFGQRENTKQMDDTQRDPPILITFGRL